MISSSVIVFFSLGYYERIALRNIMHYNTTRRRGVEVTARELKRVLETAGWKMKEGGKHTVAINRQFPTVQLVIPRGSGDLAKGTVDSILNKAGLK